MANDRGKSERPTETDYDTVDFTWLTTLARRIGDRLLPRREIEPEPDPSGTSAAAPDPRAVPEKASVAFAPEETAPVGEPAKHVEPVASAESFPATVRASWGRLALRYGLPAGIVIVVGVLAMINHFSGVDWGDDFALYLRQAKSLAIGNVGEVLRDNRFTVDNSGWNSFSPYSYPWGWPLLMAPFYMVFGMNYAVFKFLEVAAFCGFLYVFFAIVRLRAGTVAATALTLFVGLSPSFVGATDAVLSDLPYLFFAGLTLWWMDRCRIRGLLEDRRRLIILGLLLAFSYNVRREGITLVVALVSLHLAVLGGKVLRARSVQVLRAVEWKNVALPYETFLGAVVACFLVLPTAVRPSVPGTGLQNIHARSTYYRDVLAEHFGLKDPGSPVRLFGSPTAARNVLALVMILAVVGLIGRLLYRFEEEAALATFLVASSFVMLISPYEAGRYLFTITPLLAYFAYQALPTMAASWMSRDPALIPRWVSYVSAAALAGLILLNAGNLDRSTRYHLNYSYTENGPESPEAKQMLAEVRDLTRGNDVILFFRARAMTLYTDRQAVQGSDLNKMLKRSDWYVMEKNSTYSQKLLTDGEAAALGLTKAWENPGWVIWRVPPRAT